MINFTHQNNFKQHCSAELSRIQFMVGLGTIDFECALQPATWHHRYDPFAGVWIDQQTHEIIMVRDHLGQQPLYYYYQSGQFIFADNIPEILKQLPKTPDFNTDQLIELFSGHQFYRDETFYKNIYRVEPGTITKIKADGSVHKTPFWRLDLQAESIHYKNEADYLEHFSELMRESVRVNTQGQTAIAAEFSGGLDSTAVCVTAYELGLRVPLLMHEAPRGCINEDYDKSGEDVFIKKYNPHVLHRVNADDFDLVSLMQQQAQWFAGSCPYVFTLLMNNVHQAAINQGYKILLSGFGGDQGVSGHAFNRIFLPELLRQKKYRQAMHELMAEHRVNHKMSPRLMRRLIQLMKLSHPVAFRYLQKVEDIEQAIKHFIKRTKDERSSLAKPVYYRSIREYECDYLQGSRSHEIRLRIESSAVVGKQLGFAYRYPLLYPPLLDYYCRFPLSQKRRDGVGRLLMRRYLDQYFPAGEFSRNQKTQGLHIMPATRDKCEELRDAGHLNDVFKELPFQHYINLARNDWSLLMNQMYAYMFKCFSDF